MFSLEYTGILYVSLLIYVEILEALSSHRQTEFMYKIVSVNIKF